MLHSTVKVQTPEGIELSLPVAGLVARSLAWSIDFALRLFLYAIFAWLGGALLIQLLFDKVSAAEQGAAYMAGLGFLLYFLIEWFFTAVPEALFGTTPGKKIMGLYVVHIDGTPIGWQSALLRNFLRFADFLPFFYFSAVVCMLMHKQSRRLGDLAASTMVVYSAENTAQLERGQQAGIEPPRALRAEERAAILEFDERCDGLSNERQLELVALLPDLQRAPAAQGVADIRAWARWIRSGKVEGAGANTDAA